MSLEGPFLQVRGHLGMRLCFKFQWESMGTSPRPYSLTHGGGNRDAEQPLWGSRSTVTSRSCVGSRALEACGHCSSRALLETFREAAPPLTLRSVTRNSLSNFIPKCQTFHLTAINVLKFFLLCSLFREVRDEPTSSILCEYYCHWPWGHAVFVVGSRLVLLPVHALNYSELDYGTV